MKGLMQSTAARAILCLPLCALPLAAWLVPASGQEVDKRIQEAEAKRIASIAKVRPAVVAVFAPGGQGGGSGVVVSKDGYALTNFHVVQGRHFFECGMADGVLYNAVVCGIDPVGDVAVIKLVPKEEGKPFPFAPMGDSDKVRAGDWSLAMGNPFLLATDFTPTVTFGLISGMHRYQYPSGTILEYTDCIQIDTSINPGNSGGPLFNLDGEVIGINGRGSFEKRGRVNSGVGYAISINQIKNFLGHLKGGWEVDHATLGANVRVTEEGQIVVSRILEESDVYRRGLETDDELFYFSGRRVGSVNDFKNVLGVYPKGWRVPLVYRHRNENNEIEKKEILVRLMGLRPAVKDEEGTPIDPEKPPKPEPGKPPMPKPMPRPGMPPAAPPPDAVAKLYEAKEGFANHYFNKLERQRVYDAFKKHGDFSKLVGAWSIEAEETQAQKKGAVQASIDDKIVTLKVGDVDFSLDPVKDGAMKENLYNPKDSGGLLVALFHWRRLLELGEKGFEKGAWLYGGYEPFYPEGKPESRVEAETLMTEYVGVSCKWFFSQKDQTLLGFECYIEKDKDPCEVSFLDYKEVDGRKLPQRIEVRFKDKPYGIYAIKSYKLADK